MSSIYDNKENIKDNKKLDYEGFIEVCARMVIKKNEIFTKIFENHRDNLKKTPQEVVEGVDKAQLEKRQEEHQNEGNGSVDGDPQQDPEKIDDSEYYQNISDTPISAFEGFI